MNIEEIIGIVSAFIKMVETMPDSRLKILIYGVAANALAWQLPELIQSVRWW